MGTLAEYKKTCETMRERKLDFFTFTPNEDKTKTMILKGIDGCFSVEEILEDLRSNAGDDLEFLGVAPFTTANSKKLNRILPMFLVKLSPKSNLTKLPNIKKILYQTVSWEALRKTDPIQCKRCQRMGHVAINCNLNYRCVKCDSSHEPGECKIKTSEERVDKSAIYCVHCKNFGHPASYRGCPKLVEYNKIIKKKIDENNDKKNARLEKIAGKVNLTISYSSIAASTQSAAEQLLNNPTENNTNVEIRQQIISQDQSEHTVTTENNPNSFNQLMILLQKIQEAVAKNTENIQRLSNLYDQRLSLTPIDG